MTTPARPLRIIGRDLELSQLDLALRIARSGTGAAFFLVGDAGIGKSRLVTECARTAADLGLPVLRGRGGAATGRLMPFRPLVEALGSHLRAGSGPTQAESWPALGRLVPEWRAETTGGPPHTLTDVAEGLLRMLVALGRATGCLLVLEDLHDADPETTAVVEYLVDNIGQTPVLLIATLRPEAGRMLDTANAAHRRRVATVAELRPLSPAQVREFVADCLGTAPDNVPAPVSDRLARDAGGIPYLVEELLAAILDSGTLRRAGSAAGWEVTAELGALLPTTIVRDHADRLGRLDPPVRDTLLAAAVLGTRFGVPTLRLVTGHPERELLAHLRTATQARFLVPDPAAPDHYGFRHDLTTQAILATLLPAELAAISRGAAAAIRAAETPLPPGRAELVARLLHRAGEHAEAARCYAEAGRRAMSGGSTGSAVAMLEIAHDLAAGADRDDIAAALIQALAEDGQLDRALAMAGELAPAGPGPAAIRRRVELHTRLAWLAMSAGRMADAWPRMAAATALLGTDPSDELAAPLAVVEAHLAHRASLAGDPGTRAEEQYARAQRLARQSADLAERLPLPTVACQAWELLAQLARRQGFDEADACLRRILALADEHRLPTVRADALLRLGINDSLRTGEVAHMEQALHLARSMGSIVLENTAECVRALSAVLRGEYALAAELVERALPVSARLGNAGNVAYLHVTAAMRAAHRGDRAGMAPELAAFGRCRGESSMLQPVAWGLAEAVCALLEEDRPAAEAVLARVLAWEGRNPSGYQQTGRYGLLPLLDALAGRLDRARHGEVAAAAAATLGWNRQFVALAEAVLLGRDGRGDAAVAAVAAAQAAGAPFPMARHLGLRLVAEAAIRDGWGHPVEWLRTAEEHFHAAGIPAVVAACRTLLRRAGASAVQHRSGREQIPAALLRHGVTVREYEVLRLISAHLGNQQIARRLGISPRTVEKHVANLLAKTGCRDRAGLLALVPQPSAGQ